MIFFCSKRLLWSLNSLNNQFMDSDCNYLHYTLISVTFNWK